MSINFKSTASNIILNTVSNVAFGAVTNVIGSLLSSGGGFGKLAARVTDMTVGICNHGMPCCPHLTVGQHIIGSFNTSINGLPAVRLSDMSIHSCPHCGIGWAIQSSFTDIVNYLGQHRLLDMVLQPGGIAHTVTASFNTLIGL